jgi:hypothetical protein
MRCTLSCVFSGALPCALLCHAVYAQFAVRSPLSCALFALCREPLFCHVYLQRMLCSACLPYGELANPHGILFYAVPRRTANRRCRNRFSGSVLNTEPSIILFGFPIGSTGLFHVGHRPGWGFLTLRGQISQLPYSSQSSVPCYSRLKKIPSINVRDVRQKSVSS